MTHVDRNEQLPFSVLAPMENNADRQTSSNGVVAFAAPDLLEVQCWSGGIFDELRQGVDRSLLIAG
jgi:hypothetical protein